MKPNRSGEREWKEKLEVATAAHGQALNRFRAVLRDIPGGFPHPDGSERILKASRELKQAHRGVIAALSALKRNSAAGVRKKKLI